MKLKHLGTLKRILATSLSVMMIATLPNVPGYEMPQVQAAKVVTATEISEDFEDFETTDNLAGGSWGAELVPSSDAHSGAKSLQVTVGEAGAWSSYVYDNIDQFAGKKVNFSAFAKCAEAGNIHVTVKYTDENDEEKYTGFGSTELKADEWTEMSDTFVFPTTAVAMYFELNDGAGKTFLLDDVRFIVDGTAPSITEDFQDATLDTLKGGKFGNPTLEIVNYPENSENKVLYIDKGDQNWQSYAYNLEKFAGNKILVSAKVAFTGDDAPVASAISGSTIVKPEDIPEQNLFKVTTKMEHADGTDAQYDTVMTANVTAGDLQYVEAEYDVPEGKKSYSLYFESPNGRLLYLDDVSVTVVGEYKEPAKVNYVDISDYAVLKDLYKDYFKMGMAGQAISHWGQQTSEIGNPYKEALIKKEFNSFTFGNELKPEYCMGIGVEGTTDTNLEFVPTPAVIELLNWCKTNDIQVRAHVLVWHSQVRNEIFCKDYTPVYVDPSAEQKVLDPSCYVDAETLKLRMTSYIDNAIKYTYEHGYGNTIYAWDVVNEAIEPGMNEKNMRNSYWRQIIGDDFMYYAFKAAREAVDTYSEQFKDEVYEGNVSKAKLFYNDYNENQPAKVQAIIDAFTREENGHGSIIGDGYVDGMGMQAHYKDTTGIGTVLDAMRAYDEAFGEVHVTELDVSQSDTRNINADIYQAQFYKELFQGFVDAVKDGVNLTSVTIWGLTDETSWIEGGNPLLFKETLDKKYAFDAIVSVMDPSVTIPEPIYIKPDISDIYIDFEGENDTAESVGLIVRGGGTLEVQGDIVYEGKKALKDSGRTANWNGTSINVSKYSGQTVEISAYVKCADPFVKISADIDGVWPNITKQDTSSGEWTKITGRYRIPLDQASLNVYFESAGLTDDDEATADIYIDNIQVKLVGLVEDFEDTMNVSSIRGDAHMPVLTVTDQVFRGEAGHSLMITRQDSTASANFDISQYVGKTVNIEAYVKTDDNKITLGFQGVNAEELTTVDAVKGDWTKVTGKVDISDDLRAAKLYILTDGNATIYVDDIFVSINKGNDTPNTPDSGNSSIIAPSYPAEEPTKDSEPSKEPSNTEVKPEVIEDENSKTIIYTPDVTTEPILSRSDVKNALKSGKDVNVKLVNKDGKVEVAWTFKAENYDKKVAFKKVNLAVTVSESTEIANQTGLIVDFKQEGKIPMQATVKVDASKQFKAGDTVYVYIVNKETGKLDCVPNSKRTVDKDGYLALDIITGADYVVLPKAAKKSEKTTVVSQVSVNEVGTLVKGTKTTLKLDLPDTVVQVSKMNKFDEEVNTATYGAVVSYSTSDKNIATVDKNGKINAKGKGKVTITVKVVLSNGSSKSFKQTITVK